MKLIIAAITGRLIAASCGGGYGGGYSGGYGNNGDSYGMTSCRSNNYGDNNGYDRYGGYGSNSGGNDDNSGGGDDDNSGGDDDYGGDDDNGGDDDYSGGDDEYDSSVSSRGHSRPHHKNNSCLTQQLTEDGQWGLER